ncbi:hypothetical protein ACIBK8_32825 [Streptomyces sp. NPDC050161]|uniref:hypothetical protein n=1 Tax=Streptomyces sp. NPDC050161 TaxID=3365604 RepID=UPI00378B643F
MTTTELLGTTTHPDWEAVEVHLARHIGPNASPLPELTALLDEDLHHLVLDPDSRTIWWAWDNTPLNEEGWTVEHLTPEAAAEQLSDEIDRIQDRQDAPEQYDGDTSALDRDQEALDEYAAILRLTLPAEPDRAAAHIKHRRRLVARQDALWQRTYAELVRDQAGTEWGGNTRAARALGVTDVQIGRIIKDDDKRRAALADAVNATRDAVGNSC